MNELNEFEEDCDRIRLEKFFRFHPVDSASTLADLPEDYREFLLKFGEVDLIRDSVNPWHYLHVYAPLKELADGATNVKVGYQFDLGEVFLDRNAGDWRVASFRPGAKTSKSWKSFTDWFLAAYRKSKKALCKADWKKAQQPAALFTQEEQQIVDARRKFSVSLVSVIEPSSVVLRVRNRSELTLNRYTFGMRMPGGMDGWSSVPTSDIGPGESLDITRETYHYGDLDKLEIYELPDPEPEDRDYYFEFDDLPETRLPDPPADPHSENQFSNSASKSDRSTGDPRFGDWKFSDEVTLKDFLQHPIWLWCLDLSTDEDGEDGPINGNESSMRPWLEGDNVTTEMKSPVILLRLNGTDLFARGV